MHGDIVHGHKSDTNEITLLVERVSEFSVDEKLINLLHHLVCLVTGQELLDGVHRVQPTTFLSKSDEDGFLIHSELFRKDVCNTADVVAPGDALVTTLSLQVLAKHLLVVETEERVVNERAGKVDGSLHFFFNAPYL